jgi:hypothetical protein
LGCQLWFGFALLVQLRFRLKNIVGPLGFKKKTPPHNIKTIIAAIIIKIMGVIFAKRTLWFLQIKGVGLVQQY